MKRINKYIIALLLMCSIFNGPKSLGWWNLIYNNEVFCHSTEYDERDVKFFIWEWLSSFKR